MQSLRITTKQKLVIDETRRRIAGERAFAILAGQHRDDHTSLLSRVCVPPVTENASTATTASSPAAAAAAASEAITPAPPDRDYLASFRPASALSAAPDIKVKQGFIDSDDSIAEQQRIRLERFRLLQIRKAAEVAQRAAQAASRKAEIAANAARCPSEPSASGFAHRTLVKPAENAGGPLTRIQSSADDDSDSYLNFLCSPSEAAHAKPAAVSGRQIPDNNERRRLVSRKSRISASDVAAAGVAQSGVDVNFVAGVGVAVASARVGLPQRPPAGGPGVSNRTRIVNALRHVCLAGAHRETELRAALGSMESDGVPQAEDDKTSFLVLLASPESPQYRALYRLVRGGSCVKVHGSRLAPHDISGVIEQAILDAATSRGGDCATGGPVRPLQRWTVSATWKYESGQRKFLLLPTNAPGLTTDAFSLAPVK